MMEDGLDQQYKEHEQAGLILESMPVILDLYFTKTREQFEKNRNGLNKRERNLPEIDTEAMQLLGIPIFEGELDEEKTRTFRKEDYLEASDDFQIVRDPEGRLWLLKLVSRLWKEKSSYSPQFPKIERLMGLRRAQREVLAYRAARAIDYPVPETRLVQRNGKPFIAYEYLEGARDWSFPEARLSDSQRGIAIANPEAILTRTLFNVLIGSEDDNSCQGIVDKQSRYFAQDISLNYSLASGKQNFETFTEKTVAKLRAAEKASDRSLYYGKMPSETSQSRAAWQNLFSRLDGLKWEAVETIFSDLLGSKREKEVFARIFLRRAKILEDIPSFCKYEPLPGSIQKLIKRANISLAGFEDMTNFDGSSYNKQQIARSNRRQLERIASDWLLMGKTEEEVKKFIEAMIESKQKS